MSLSWIWLVLIFGSLTNQMDGELTMDETIKLFNETVNRFHNVLGNGVSHYSYAFARPDGSLIQGTVRYLDHREPASGYVIHLDGTRDYYYPDDIVIRRVTKEQYSSPEFLANAVKKVIEARKDHSVEKRSITNDVGENNLKENSLDGNDKGTDLQCKDECDCDTSFEPYCDPPSEVKLDKCGCCKVCTGKQLMFCNTEHKCKEVGSVCVYTKPNKSAGYCKVLGVDGCTMHGETFITEQQFSPECRIVCVCHEDNTSTCFDICHSERTKPKDMCKFPKLIMSSDGCCRLWTCDEYLVNHPECLTRSMRWSECSTDCGLGYSNRVSNDNLQCNHKNETKLCYTRACGLPMTTNLVSHMSTPDHKIRHQHNCKSTLKLPEKVRLRIGKCFSVGKHEINLCSYCSGYDCSASMTYGKNIDFICPQIDDPEFVTSVGKDILDLHGTKNIDTENTLIFAVDILLVQKCKCKKIADSNDIKLKVVTNATEQVPWIRNAFVYKEKPYNVY